MRKLLLGGFNTLVNKIHYRHNDYDDNDFHCYQSTLVAFARIVLMHITYQYARLHSFCEAVLDLALLFRIGCAFWGQFEIA